MTNHSANRIHIESEVDLLTARHAVREASIELGFSIVDQTRLVTAVSEITRNAFLYAGMGELAFDPIEELGRQGLVVTITDNGPGIEDIEQVMVDGYSTRNGMGHGLGGTKRLVDKFTITSTPGKGTQVEIVKWKG